jgi:hypothetical protein
MVFESEMGPIDGGICDSDSLLGDARLKVSCFGDTSRRKLFGRGHNYFSAACLRLDLLQFSDTAWQELRTRTPKANTEYTSPSEHLDCQHIIKMGYGQH